jgi:hypothetical protein
MQPSHLIRRLGLALALCGPTTWGSEPPAGAPSPVVFSFATLGDSRAEPGAPGNSAQDELWLQNTAVLARLLHEIEQQHPQALVFNGDMIHGYTADAAGIDRQYAFWRGMVAGLLEGGTYVLPVPGNHEVQVPMPKPGGGSVKLAQASREAAWRRNMGDLILDQARWKRTTRTTATGWRVEHRPSLESDSLATDQSQLSYSFDVGQIHMTVLNTDPVGLDGSVPLNWLKGDLEAAKARGARRFFVFGHKMAFTYVPTGGPGKEKEGGLDGRKDMREAFWDLVERFGVTYFCGHQHVYHASQPRQADGGRAWQIIVGTAGSPFGIKPGQSRNPLDRLYAWAQVEMYQDGSATIQVWGFDDQGGPTHLLERIQLAD